MGLTAPGPPVTVVHFDAAHLRQAHLLDSRTSRLSTQSPSLADGILGTHRVVLSDSGRGIFGARGWCREHSADTSASWSAVPAATGSGRPTFVDLPPWLSVALRGDRG